MANTQEAQPTQQFIEINEIKQDTIILRNGGLRKVLIISGLNFDLKSEEEREIIIYSFQSFLNSLNFPVQIFIHSRKINIEEYLSKLAVRQQEESMELLKNIIGEYQEFIRSFVGQNAIMEKTFFVVVPYDIIEVPKAGRNLVRNILGVFGKKKPTVEADIATAEKSFDQHLQQLTQRVDQVINGLNQVGLRAVALNESEITELFYNLYNPESVEKKL